MIGMPANAPGLGIVGTRMSLAAAPHDGRHAVKDAYEVPEGSRGRCPPELHCLDWS